MWEEVALEYNSRRGRSWLKRDYDSMRQKSRYLYDKMKPTGNNDGLPPKLLPIALAHDEAGVEGDDDPATRDSASDDGREDEEDSQASVVDFCQRGQFGADAALKCTPTAVGTVVTKRSTFDASLGEGV
ncbi:hypothetical protein PF011_g18411 [Phytophthora fragariae]|uniref:DUF6818 domain-containing protein n=1 Tax=Phytophthora fragariae TaxID=53985 RepID=A0A6A3JFG8_9STRA|nr:hypothetical protein PF011_g18411 [Phytophthora fragariae]